MCFRRYSPVGFAVVFFDLSMDWKIVPSAQRKKIRIARITKTITIPVTTVDPINPQLPSTLMRSVTTSEAAADNDIKLLNVVQLLSFSLLKERFYFNPQNQIYYTTFLPKFQAVF